MRTETLYSAGVQFASGSIEFKLLLFRYAKELRFRCDMEHVKHYKDSIFLLLMARDKVSNFSSTVMPEIDNRFNEVVRRLDFYGAKDFVERKLKSREEKDKANMDYLKAIGSDPFDSIGELMTRVAKVQSRSR